IGDRYGDACRAACSLGVAHQVGKVIVDVAHQFKIDQELVHGSVADSFADPEGGSVKPVGAGLEGGNRTYHSEASVLLAVPVDFHVLPTFPNNHLNPC